MSNGVSYHQHGVLQPYDPLRTARFAVFGLTMGPFLGKSCVRLFSPLFSSNRRPERERERERESLWKGSAALTQGKWLMVLEKVFPFPAKGSAVPAVVKRVLADQVVL